MFEFNYTGALLRGFSEEQIARHLAKESDQDYESFEKKGLSPEQINDHLMASGEVIQYQEKPEWWGDYSSEEQNKILTGLHKYNASSPEQRVSLSTIKDKNFISEFASGLWEGLVNKTPETLARAARNAFGEHDPMKQEQGVLDRYIDQQVDESRNTPPTAGRLAGAKLPTAAYEGGSNIAPSLAAMAPGVVAGAVTMNPFAGAGVSAAASGGIFYGATKDQFRQNFYEALQSDLGRGLAQEEYDKIDKEIDAAGTQSGLWEAGTEAAGAAFFHLLFLSPVVGNVLSKAPGAKNAIIRFAGKTGANYAEEVAGETITQKKQTDIEHEVGLSDEPGNYADAFKDVALPTAFATGGQALGLQGVSSLSRKPAIHGEDEAPPVDDLGDIDPQTPPNVFVGPQPSPEQRPTPEPKQEDGYKVGKDFVKSGVEAALKKRKNVAKSEPAPKPEPSPIAEPVKPIAGEFIPGNTDFTPENVEYEEEFNLDDLDLSEINLESVDLFPDGIPQGDNQKEAVETDVPIKNTPSASDASALQGDIPGTKSGLSGDQVGTKQKNKLAEDRVIKDLLEKANHNNMRFGKKTLTPLAVDIAQDAIDTRARMTKEKRVELAEKHDVPEDIVHQMTTGGAGYETVLGHMERGGKDEAIFLKNKPGQNHVATSDSVTTEKQEITEKTDAAEISTDLEIPQSTVDTDELAEKTELVEISANKTQLTPGAKVEYKTKKGTATGSIQKAYPKNAGMFVINKEGGGTTIIKSHAIVGGVGSGIQKAPKGDSEKVGEAEALKQRALPITTPKTNKSEVPTPAQADITTKSGQPFKNEGTAKLWIARNKAQKTHEPVRVKEGWVGREKAKEVKGTIEDLKSLADAIHMAGEESDLSPQAIRIAKEFFGIDPDRLNTSVLIEELDKYGIEKDGALKKVHSHFYKNDPKTIESDILTHNGKPFKGKGNTTLAIIKAKARDTHDAVQVDGGWVGREREVPAIGESDYDRKQKEKAAKYEELADKAVERADAQQKRSRDMIDQIPMGQPILVGHHSEKRHRADLNRADTAMRKGMAEMGKAGYYAKKAENAANPRGISSDDSNAIAKLKEKLRGLEQKQEEMKAVNKIAKSKKLSAEQKRKEITDATGWKEETAKAIIEPDYAGRVGFPSYELSNNNANIRSTKKRVAGLEAIASDETTEIDFDGGTIIDNVEDNRVQIVYDGKPDADIRKELRSRGFRWSPQAGAWQRKRGGNALYDAQNLVGATPQYSTTTTPSANPITPEKVKAYFKDRNLQTGTTPEGHLWIRTPGGLGFAVKTVDRFSDKEYELSISSGAMDRTGHIAGNLVGHKIKLAMDFADQKTLNHELTHLLENSGILTKGDLLILDVKAKQYAKNNKSFKLQIDKRENRANYLSQVLADREAHRGTALGKVLQKIADSLDALIRIGRASVRKTARGMESGEIYNLPIKKAGNIHLPAFQKWFDGSVVVNADGSPKVRYHGTVDSFSVFDKDKYAYSNSKGKYKAHSFFFGDSGIANYFAKAKGKAHNRGNREQVLPVYLSLNNPLDLRENIDPALKIIEGTEGLEPLTKEQQESIVKAPWSFFHGPFGDHFVDALILGGYDGAIFNEKGSQVETVFSPEQIKSTFNTGEWNESNPGIQHQTQKNTETPTFKKWFGKSVVTVDGKVGSEPLVVYHGTNAKFDSFKRSKHGQAGDGIYLTPFGGDAGMYGKRLIKAYASLKNPRRIQRSEIPMDVKSFRSNTENMGHDGIIITNANSEIDEIVAFDPTQIKSVENKGTWSQTDSRIQYSTTSQQDLDEAQNKALNKVKDLLKAVAKPRKLTATKPDISPAERVISTLSHYAERTPTSQAIADTILNKSAFKTEKETDLFSDGNGVDLFKKILVDLERKNKFLYKKLNSYFLKKDLSGRGWTIKEETSEWVARNHKKAEIGRFESEHEAEHAAIKDEAANYKGSAEEKNGLYATRQIYLNTFHHLHDQWGQIIEDAQREGVPIPDVTIETEEGLVSVDLATARKMMGDIRGSYFPRIRKSGKYQLHAKGPKGEILERSDNKIRLNLRGNELERQGYKIEVSKTESLPESVFASLRQSVNVNAAINRSLAKLPPHKRNLSDMGIKSRWEGNDFLITGNVDSNMDQYIEAIGGKFEDVFKVGKNYKSYTPTYVFKDAKKGIEKEAANAIYRSKGMGTNVNKQLAANLVTDMADEIKSHGAMSRMIRRSTKIGNDVVRGYEEDLNTATASLVSSIAGSHAKRKVAQTSYALLMGQEESWAEFKGKHPDGQQLDALQEELDDMTLSSEEDLIKIKDARQRISSLKWNLFEGKDNSVASIEAMLKEIKSLNGEIKSSLKYADIGKSKKIKQKLAAINVTMREEYAQQVNTKKIDPASQPNLYDGLTETLDDVLRNDDAVDRAVNRVRAATVFYFLAGRVSSSVVNLTAMAVNAPARMKADGIQFRKAAKNIGVAIKLYGQFKHGKKSLPKDQQALFQAITDKGLDIAQFNMEAFRAIQTKTGKAWTNTMMALMKPFGITEQINRAGTIAGAYISLAEKSGRPLVDKDGNVHNDMLQHAKKISDDAHGVYEKANRPDWMKGNSPAAKIFSIPYIFQTFTHNFLLTMGKMGYRGIKDIDLKNPRSWKNDNVQGALWMAFAPAIFGVGSSLGASALIGAIGKALGSDDPEEDFFKYLEKNHGPMAERFARYGVAGMMEHGVDFSGSLSIGIPDAGLGAFGSMAEDMWEGIQNVGKGFYWEAAEDFAPSFIKNPMEAMRKYKHGTTTYSGSPIFYEGEQVKHDEIDVFLELLSFRPSREGIKLDKRWSSRKAKAKYSEARSDIYRHFKAYIKDPSPTARMKVMKMVNDYNHRVRDKDLKPMGINYITKKTLTASLKVKN